MEVGRPFLVGAEEEHLAIEETQVRPQAYHTEDSGRRQILQREKEQPDTEQEEAIYSHADMRHPPPRPPLREWGCRCWAAALQKALQRFTKRCYDLVKTPLPDRTLSYIKCSYDCAPDNRHRPPCPIPACTDEVNVSVPMP